tara:strand:- start:131 stop:349 length:219 start_codon:yes stop_codon:yes gene_type:complete
MNKKQFQKELTKAENDLFDLVMTNILFLNRNGYDLGTIKDMFDNTIDHALDEYEIKILNNPKALNYLDKMGY